MKQFFKELFEYNFYFNQSMFQVLIDQHKQIGYSLKKITTNR
ncbi:MAG: hypothetical protein KatS3mg035_0928 [Bacteroidia bacterium]|nr:MAG: hypothetical protein KatS3mg035_0928 [Bacteroidia bacterium]